MTEQQLKFCKLCKLLTPQEFLSNGICEACWTRKQQQEEEILADELYEDEFPQEEEC